MRARMAKCNGERCLNNDIKHLNVDMIKHSGKYYCDSCLKKLKRSKEHRANLYHYIQDMSGVSFPTGRMLRKIKELRNTNYTYFGIHQSLRYMVEVKNKSLSNDYFLGYVPFIYEDAKAWYIESLTEQKQRDRKGFKDQKQPTKIEFNYQMNSNKSKDLISADGLLD